MVQKIARLTAVALCAFVTACTTAFVPAPSSSTGAAAPSSSADAATSPSSVSVPGRLGSERPAAQATAALLADSRSAAAAGDDARAAAILERAVGIDPNDAALWIELAEIRLRQGDRDQADALARKALTLAGNDRLVTSRAERLLERR